MDANAASALNPGVARREVFGWAMYDFANSGYTTVVLTAVFNAYFVATVAGNAPWATFAWTVALGVSYAIVMVAGPVVGAWADARAAKKRALAATTVACVAGTALLAGAGPGDVAWAVAFIVVSNVAYALGENITAAFLPELARPAAVGRVSGWGWSLGYFGGILALGLSLAWVLSAPARGSTTAQSVAGTMLLTAAVFAIASLPTFLLLRERAVPAPRTARPVARARAPGAHREGGGGIPRPARGLRLRHLLPGGGGDRDRARGDLRRAGDGVPDEGHDPAHHRGERDGGHRRLRASATRRIASARCGRCASRSSAWIVMVVVAYFGTTQAVFWIAANLAGLAMGSSQSAGRALVAYFSPPDRSAEFFGLWGVATRLASILGPVTYGAFTWAPAATTASRSS